ncbi:MAG: hypothetical protein OQK51_10840 [Kangiellaceae bacterium]|nr:hypothetical protein [Kangiellaceae bacterium]
MLLKHVFIITFVLSVIQTSSASANDQLSENLMVDQTIVNSQIIQFRNDDKVYPEKSQFEIIHALTMSNEQGERWATITFQNKAGGRRILESDHLLALFADGKRVFPRMEDEIFERKEIRSITVPFGNSKFPILTLVTRDK